MFKELKSAILECQRLSTPPSVESCRIQVQVEWSQISLRIEQSSLVQPEVLQAQIKGHRRQKKVGRRTMSLQN